MNTSDSRNEQETKNQAQSGEGEAGEELVYCCCAPEGSAVNDINEKSGCSCGTTCGCEPICECGTCACG